MIIELQFVLVTLVIQKIKNQCMVIRMGNKCSSVDNASPFINVFDCQILIQFCERDIYMYSDSQVGRVCECVHVCIQCLTTNPPPGRLNADYCPFCDV